MTKGTQDSASKPAEAPSGKRATPPPGVAAEQAATAQQPRVVSRPEDVAGLVLMQIDLVNARKDDLTISIKGLSDLTRQLVRAYGENMQTIGVDFATGGEFVDKDHRHHAPETRPDIKIKVEKKAGYRSAKNGVG